MWLPNDNVHSCCSQSVQKTLSHCLDNITDSGSGGVTTGKVTVSDFLDTIKNMPVL